MFWHVCSSCVHVYCVAQAMVHVSAWVEFGVGEVLGSADKGDQEHDGEVGVQQGRHQQRFHWHPELESRIIIINPIRYDMIFAYFIGIADGSKILPESFGASQQVILQTLTSIQLPLLFFRFPDVRREQLPSKCIVQSPPAEILSWVQPVHYLYINILVQSVWADLYRQYSMEHVCALLVMSIGWRKKNIIVESVGQFPS